MQALKWIALTVGLLSINQPARSESPNVVFAAIGDQPYSQSDEGLTQATLDYLNQAQSGTQWILHVGDLKGGGEVCSDSLIGHRLGQLKSSTKPLIFVPGDNEWADCHRESNGQYRPLERLQFLRKQAFEQGSSLNGKAFNAANQGAYGYPEHLMWGLGRTLFVSLNIPGSNNNLENPKSRAESASQVMSEYESRMDAVGKWLRTAQEKVLQGKYQEVVIAMQGNPFDGSGQSRLGLQWLGPKDGYQQFRQQLIDFTQAVGKPVLLIHGDTHRFKFDQPLSSQYKGLPLYRLETWGHPFQNRWVRVTIRSGEPQPFLAESLALPLQEP